MLRQYQTGARGAACLSPSVRWALKGNGEAAASGHAWPMSTKILAVGVTLVGGLVLSVALIMGLEFPKHVRSHLRDDQCVVHERHPKFQSWRNGSQCRREVRLRYYHLLNQHHFLYNGAKPQFEERGPYVYTEYETREDVKFSVSEVTYRVSRRHVFNAISTAKECPTCRENDTVTVLNTDFLRRVYETGGHANYLLSILPSSLKAILALERLYAAHTLQANISTLGCLDPVCDGGDLLDVVANVSFGKWLRTSGNGSYSSVIVNSRAGSPSFTASETGALYAAVLNSSVLGSEAFSSPSPGSAVHTECGAWARSLCLGQPFPASLASLDSSLCGLAHVLRACQSGSVQQPAVRAMLTSAFCAPGLPFCLDLSSTTVHVLSAYFEAFRDFILQHLLRVVHDYFLAQNNRDLVVTRSQSELTLGYYVSDDADQSAQHVQGFLDEDWLKTSSQEGLVWKVDTCLKDRNMNSNMRVREFNGSQYAPQWLLRDARYPVPVSGQTDFFAACNPTACCACAAPGSDVYLFLPTLRRTVRFTGGDVISLWNNDVFRYWLSQDAFSWSDYYDVSCGLQKMTSALGFVGWISIPGLDADLLENVGNSPRNCTVPKSQSFLDLEPVTGRVWRRTIQLQLNAGIRSSDVTGPRGRPLNVTYLDKAAPVVWFERRLALSGTELAFYDYKVDRLMKVSCGGLIGLSVVAVIVVGIGVVILFQPKRLNRVGPGVDGESSAPNLHARHFNVT